MSVDREIGLIGVTIAWYEGQCFNAIKKINYITILGRYLHLKPGQFPLYTCSFLIRAWTRQPSTQFFTPNASPRDPTTGLDEPRDQQKPLLTTIITKPFNVLS